MKLSVNWSEFEGAASQKGVSSRVLAERRRERRERGSGEKGK